MEITEFSEEQLLAYLALTPLQQGVALQRVANPHMSKVACYINGGGEAKSYDSQCQSAYQIFSNLQFDKFLKMFVAESTNPLVMGRDEILERLSMVARTSLSDVLDIIDTTDEDIINTETGEVVKQQTAWKLKDVDDMTNGGMMAVSELTATKDGFKIKTHSQLAAMKQLADLQGLNAPERKEISGPGGGPIAIRDMDDETLFDELKGMGLDV